MMMMNGQNFHFVPQMTITARAQQAGQQAPQQQQPQQPTMQSVQPAAQSVQPAAQYILQTGSYVTTGATVAMTTTNVSDIAGQPQQQQQLAYGGQLYATGKTEPLTKDMDAKQPQKGNTTSYVINQDRFNQMQQQYERRIESLEQEVQELKQQQQLQQNTLQPAKAARANRSVASNNNNNTASVSPHIVETYHEDLRARVFACKNCSYKAKSEAALVIHNTNHLVTQRYLHLPTTVFAVKMDNETEAAATTNANPYQYPCGECNGKFTKNDLYLHIYEHHTGEHPYHCEECNLFFVHFEFLDNHQRTQHMRHPCKSKRARSANSTTSTSSELVYYSVVKSSKPFSAFTNWTRGRGEADGERPQQQQQQHSLMGTTHGAAAYNYSSAGGGSKRTRAGTKPAVGNRLTYLQAKQNAVTNGDASKAGDAADDEGQVSGDSEATVAGVYKCHFPQCQFQTSDKQRLDFHLDAHRNSRFRCRYCPYVSNVLSDIKRHLMRGGKHEGLYMYCCPNCPAPGEEGSDFRTNYERTFKDHIRAVHFGKNVDDKSLNDYIESLFANNPRPDSPTLSIAMDGNV